MKKQILSLIILASLGLIVLSVAPTMAAGSLKDAFSKDGLLNATGEGAGYNTEQRSIDPVIANVIAVALSMLGAVFLVLMIYGGYIWMTAAGNQELVTKARNLIVAAIIGLLVVIAAYVFTYFIFARLANPLIE